MIQPQRCHIMLNSIHQFSIPAHSSTQGRRDVKVRLTSFFRTSTWVQISSLNPPGWSKVRPPPSPSFICFMLEPNRIKEDNCCKSKRPWRQEKADTVNEWIKVLRSKCALKYANMEIRTLWCHKGLRWYLVWSWKTTSQPPCFRSPSTHSRSNKVS